MAPSPRKRVAAFSASWTASDATSFDPAALPVARRPRAWERKQHITKRDGKEKKVWRTYATRSETSNKGAAVVAEEQDAQVRAVKRQLRVRPTDLEHLPGTPRSKKRAFKATRFHRRESVLPRKNIASQTAIAHSAVDSAPANPEIQPSFEDSHTVNHTPKEVPHIQELGMQEVASTGRRRSARLSGFVLAAGKRDSLPVQPSRDLRSPGPKALSSPRKSKPPLKVSEDVYSGPQDHDLQVPHQSLSMDATKEDQANGETIDGTESSDDTTSEDEHEQDLVAGELVAEETSPAVPEADPSSDQEEDQSAESEEEPETDLSRLSLDSDEAIPGEDNTVSETELPKEAAEEDFTEASMQLDLLGEVPSPTAAEHEPEFREHREPTPEDVLPSIEGPDESPKEEEPSQAQDESIVSAEDSMDTTEDLPSPIKQEPVTPNLEDVPEADGLAISTDAESVTLRSSLPPVTDIAEGLTLTPTIVSRAPPPGRKLMFPSPPPPEPSADEPTGTLYLDDDTALLKDFLTRAAASKASRAEKAVTIARRTSLQNRRDSGVIRQALASPRKVLEDKDPNSPSKLIEDITLDITLDLTTTPVLTPDVPAQEPAEPETGEDEEMKDAEKDAAPASKSSRRSTRARKSRLPPSGTPAATVKTGPNKISVRRTDAGEPVVLKRTEAQELGLLTRNNTRKNKQGAVNVQLRLARLAAIAMKEKPAKDEPTPPDSASDSPVDGNGKRRIRWDATLAYYQEDTRSIENALAEAQSLATPDELSGESDVAGVIVKTKEKGKRGGASRSQRARGLGGVNGTPAKGALAPAPLLPDGVVEEKKGQSAAPVSTPAKEEKSKKGKSKEKEKESTDATVSAPATEDKKPVAPRLPAPKAGKPKKSLLVPPTPTSSLSISSPAVPALSSSLPLTTSALPSTSTSTSTSIKPPKPHDPKSSKALTKTPIPLPTPTPTASLSSSVPAPPTLLKDRKSRLATPRRVKLPGLPVPAAGAASGTKSATKTTAAPSTGALAEGKENKTLVLVAGTPKKGFKIPVSGSSGVSEAAATAGAVESGLPRRRGRKV